ncbi:signal peptidase I [Anaerolineales bacterium]
MSKRKPQQRPKARIPSFAGEVVRTILFVLVVTVLFDMAIPRSLVEGRSMEETFHDDDRLIVSRLNYLFSAPNRGEIVVFNSVDPQEKGVMLIKRIIALPGETVRFQNQQLFINDVLVEEPYIKEQCSTFRCPDKEWKLSDKEYFVMGDNRNNSHDSRAFNAIPIDHIVGEVIVRYWPPQAWGIVKSIDFPE